MKIKQAPAPKPAAHHAREQHASTMRTISPFTRGKFDVGVRPAKVYGQSKERRQQTLMETRPRLAQAKGWSGL